MPALREKLAGAPGKLPILAAAGRSWPTACPCGEFAGTAEPWAASGLRPGLRLSSVPRRERASRFEQRRSHCHHSHHHRRRWLLGLSPQAWPRWRVWNLGLSPGGSCAELSPPSCAGRSFFPLPACSATFSRPTLPTGLLPRTRPKGCAQLLIAPPQGPAPHSQGRAVRMPRQSVAWTRHSCCCGRHRLCRPETRDRLRLLQALQRPGAVWSRRPWRGQVLGWRCGPPGRQSAIASHLPFPPPAHTAHSAGKRDPTSAPPLSLRNTARLSPETLLLPESPGFRSQPRGLLPLLWFRLPCFGHLLQHKTARTRRFKPTI